MKSAFCNFALADLFFRQKRYSESIPFYEKTSKILEKRSSIAEGQDRKRLERIESAMLRHYGAALRKLNRNAEAVIVELRAKVLGSIKPDDDLLKPQPNAPDFVPDSY